MSLPGDAFSTTPVLSALSPPDNSARELLTQDFERGGVGLNNTSMGLDVQDWTCWTDGTRIWVAPVSDISAASLVLEDAAVSEVSLAFDQNMRPTVVYVAGGVCKLRWYNSLIEAVDTSLFVGATSPMVTLDDKRAPFIGTSDILLAYIRDGSVRYRQQRDRFTVEYTLGPVRPRSRLVALGMGVNNRVQVHIMSPFAAAHTDLLTDQLCVLAGEEVSPMFEGVPQEARWRSRVFIADEQPSMAWARVEADYPATLKLYGDGALAYTSPPITNNAAFRLPAGRWREWQIEVESAARVTEVALASSVDELET